MSGFNSQSGAVPVSCALLALLTAAAATAASIPAYITAAVDNPSRPDNDRERDVNRKPAEVLAFAGIKPGQKVGELMPGGGYFSRLFCQIVGPSGHVYTVSVNRAGQARSAAAGCSAAPPRCRPIPAPTSRPERRAPPISSCRAAWMWCGPARTITICTTPCSASPT